MAGDEPRPSEKSLPRIGSYDLIQPLGSGGMSSVFRARHVDNGLEVAIKVLPRTLAKNPTVLQRFLREAKSAESLEHPSIVAIYDRGLDQGRHYLVLEYVSGGDLHDRVRANGPMEVNEAVEVVRAVAEALQYAAGRGVIHRDIKPANVLIGPDGQVKVADLGLALHAEDEDERVTREGTTVGTVDYMAPEQARDSRATSVRSDIYSLGCMFYFLLTGQPPFPGGDVAEKLNRHINAPPPDVCRTRPEVPEALSRVIRKMLAKKPEARYRDYDELLAALAKLKGKAVAEAPMTALFDDDDPGLVPADDQARSAAPPMTALFDDDDPGLLPVDGFRPLTPAAPPPRPNAPISDPGSIQMADLALLDSGSDALSLPAPRQKKPQPALNRPTAPSAPGTGDLVPLDDEDDRKPGPVPVSVSAPSPAPFGGVRPRPSLGPRPAPDRGMSQSERSWVLKCALLGLGLVLLVIAVDQVIRSSQSDAPTIASPDTPVAPEAPDEPVPGAIPGARANRAPAPVAVPVPVTGKTGSKPERPPAPPFVEPMDSPPENVPEPSYGAGAEAKHLPAWVLVPPPARSGEKVVVVRRVADPGVAETKTSLHAALEVAGAGVVEVADNGPFFENEMRIAADGRVIRARSGFRPMIALMRPAKTEGGPAQTAWLDLGEKSLTLEGLHIVVDVTDQPPAVTSLFSCRGGTLTLRDCSLSLVNRSGTVRPYALFRTAATGTAKPTRVLLDRTYVRGVFSTLAEFGGGSAEVVVLRSVILNAQGSLASVSAPAPGAGVTRWLSVVRSIALTWGPILELNDPGRPSQPPRLRALGTTFAHFQSPQGVNLVVAKAEAPSALELIDWRGDANSFVGWTGFFASGPERTVRVASLAAARETWKGTDATSDESPKAWPTLPPTPAQVDLARFRTLPLARLPVLSRVASPNPTLAEQTVEAFPRLAVPAPASVATSPGATPAKAGPAARNPPPGSGMSTAEYDTRRSTVLFSTDYPGAPGTLARSTAPTAAPGRASVLATAAVIKGTRELSFDTEAPPWKGDLGLFLAEQVKAGDPLVRVRVTGSGLHGWSPVRLPDGVSLEVLVSPNLAGQFPWWGAVRGARAEALIDVRGASVLLSGVWLARDGSSGLKRLVRVENGHLVLHRCRLTAPGTIETGAGGLIGFHAPGSGPVPPRLGASLWPFDVPVDRPTCRVIDTLLTSGGDVLTAEMGRGLVALSQCAVVSGQSAFVLLPGKVARPRLEADLCLEHCTVAAEHNAVAVGPWPGTDPGPDRPWVVATTACAFFGTFDRADESGALLRADAGALAHGAVFWQSQGDALEVPCFVLTGDSPPAAGRHPDMIGQWVNFWGEHHAVQVSGPRSPAGLPAHRTVGKLHPGNVDPGDLAIDPDYPAGHRPDGVGVDLSRLGITPSPRGGRRR